MNSVEKHWVFVLPVGDKISDINVREKLYKAEKSSKFE